MNQKLLLLHGWGGSDTPHWQSYLASKVAKEYGKVSFLKFSNFDTPKLDVWLKELKNELKEFQPDIVVCHSLANTLWFHLCNQEELQEIQKLYLVAPPSMQCHIEELKEFFPLKLPKNLYAKQTQLIASDNDPYMDLDELKKIERELAVPLTLLHDGGHINSESGYGKWEWMLKEIYA